MSNSHAPDFQKRGDLSPDAPLMDRVVEQLREIFDPEIPVNIYDLGLIYDIQIDQGNQVDIKMTLTAPGCPVAQTFPDMVRSFVETVEGVRSAQVELVWDPPWTQDRLSEAAKLELGLM